jgi:hypothetical protein
MVFYSFVHPTPYAYSKDRKWTTGKEVGKEAGRRTERRPQILSFL